MYQKGWIKPRIDVQPQGLSQDDLIWIKVNVNNWDPPDRPLDLPELADYDAAAVPGLHPHDVPAATRETATCEACLQTRRGRRQTRPHTLEWGECLRAPRPPPNLAEETSRAPGLEEEEFLQEPMFDIVDPENQLTHQQAEDLFEDAVFQSRQLMPRGLP